MHSDFWRDPSRSLMQIAREHSGRADDCGQLARAAIAEIGPIEDMVFLLRGMLASYAGQPSSAGDAFKVVDAVASAINARQSQDGATRLGPKGEGAGPKDIAHD